MRLTSIPLTRGGLTDGGGTLGAAGMGAAAATMAPPPFVGFSRSSKNRRHFSSTDAGLCTHLACISST